MTATSNILSGSELAEKLLTKTVGDVENLKKQGVSLALGTIQVGESKDIQLYSNYLKKLLQRVGIDHKPLVLPNTVTESQLIDEIKKLNKDTSITGVMVFSPLPKSLDAMSILNNLDMLKDVEGRTFLKSHFGVFSPTANAVMVLLIEGIARSGSSFVGKQAVVVGHSDLVGKPAAVLLLDEHATVTVCHKETRDLSQHLLNADIVVSAVGKAHVIKGEWIKKGAIVVDVGENMLDGKLVGDIEFEAAKARAAYISPVPGGVGPLTNVMLIHNLVRLYNLKKTLNGKH